MYEVPSGVRVTVPQQSSSRVARSRKTRTRLGFPKWKNEDLKGSKRSVHLSLGPRFDMPVRRSSVLKPDRGGDHVLLYSTVDVSPVLHREPRVQIGLGAPGWTLDKHTGPRGLSGGAEVVGRGRQRRGLEVSRHRGSSGDRRWRSRWGSTCEEGKSSHCSVSRSVTIQSQTLHWLIGTQ